jgi:crotonobetainyl-CoA:carnitine CoA-transferase CaiB-like acyl-CoA transferase
MSKYPLEGIRVFFIGSTWAGPMCAALFSDMGAEVIRLESHTWIDPYRILWARDRGNLEQGPVFQVLNRNALSITLNLSQPRAIELAEAIVKISDVLLDNTSPGVLKRWGLDYAAVGAINPSIIMASISGYGQNGPMSPQSAYGPASTSLSGLASLVGYEGEDPVGMLTAYPDPVAGIFAFFSIMAALHYRVTTGKGQYIDVAQLEAVASMMPEEILDYTMNSRVASCRGNSSFWMAPHGCYRCKGEDKWITIACATEEEWQALCQATGNYQWLEDKRFVDIHFRLENRKELDKLIEQWTSGYTDYEAMEILQQAGVAAVPVFSIGNMFTDPHAQEEEYLVHLPHPEEPGSYVYNVPWKLSETPGGIRRHAPLMGEHNEYVLCELCGLPKEEFQRLVEEKVIW